MNVIIAALKRLQGRCFAGPLTSKDGEAEFIKKAELIRLYGAAVVVKDQKDSALLQKNGYPKDNICMIKIKSC